MSDPNGRHDASAAGDAPVDPDGDRGSDSAPDRPVPEPVTDDVTAELVRDAIEVARGALPVRQFSEKYDTGRPPNERQRGLVADRRERLIGDRTDR